MGSKVNKDRAPQTSSLDLQNVTAALAGTSLRAKPAIRKGVCAAIAEALPVFTAR